MEHINGQNSVFERIIDASKRGTLSFFVGAGVSALSGAPKWSKLIDLICEELGIEKKEKYSSEEFLSIPQKYFCAINNDNKKFYEFVHSCFDEQGLQPNIVHYLMCRLKPCNFITTNFDDLLEKATIQQCLYYKSVASNSEIAKINGDKYILKVHGDLQHENIVLKEEDYLNYSENYKLIETMLKSIFSTNTVVFIGYGLNDYNIKLILNWAKFLLQDSFNKPIFIYTDDKELDELDILYQESRGLKVLDYRSCSGNSELPFLERYKCVLEKVLKYSDITFENKKEIEDFEMLYQILAPLDKFETLRVYDIRKALGSYAYVETSGVIRIDDKNKMSLLISLIGGKKDIGKEIQRKYTTIMSVFNKAFIIGIEKDEEFYKIENSMTHFADKNCILFDYLGMESFINKKSNDMLTQYRKAYYLAKLRRYKESLDLFQKIAEKAFRDEDYLLCYLSQINCRSMSIAIKTISRNPFIFKKYELNEVENLALDSRTTETIFQNMPVEFQKEYSKFSDLYSEEHLHKNVYDMFIENEKLKKNMGKNVIESGITSTDKAVLRINNNLHFLLGNGLYVDEFLEFKETIKYSLKLIVEKYSIITKKVLCDDRPFKSNDNITFDEIDVYCFIEYFKSDEIVALMRKCNIKELPLNNVDKIDLMVCNLFEYYNTIASRDVDYFVLSNYEQKLKTCLKLLRYITISSTTIRKICKILFKYRYREIYLNDIILFLDSQIHNDKVSCKEIRKDLLEYIILIIDENIDALKAGKKFEILCTATGYDYWDLTRYLKSEKENYISKKLSEKVCWIINSGLNIELKSLYKCEPVLNAKTKRLLIKNAENSFESSFDFELFVNFISNKRVVNIHIKDLKRHLNSIVESQNKNNKNRNIITFPKRDPLEDMVNVGYWILSGYLNQNDFSEYVGIYDKFDFYYNPKKFDYSKFDVSWLFDLTTGAYQAIFKDKIVKEKVMGCIAKTLRENDIEKGEKEELIRVLTEYIL